MWSHVSEESHNAPSIKLKLENIFKNLKLKFPHFFSPAQIADQSIGTSSVSSESTKEIYIGSDSRENSQLVDINSKYKGQDLYYQESANNPHNHGNSNNLDSSAFTYHSPENIGYFHGPVQNVPLDLSQTGPLDLSQSGNVRRPHSSTDTEALNLSLRN